MDAKKAPAPSRKRPPPQDELKKQQQGDGNNKRQKSQPHRGNVPMQPSAPGAVSADGEVNLPVFLESLKSSIEGLDSAMKESRAAGTKRAFQQVPRDMRRRTASHNPSRVPARLRSRAKQQMRADNTPLKSKKVLKGAARAADKVKKTVRDLEKALASTETLLKAALGMAPPTGASADASTASKASQISLTDSAAVEEALANARELSNLLGQHKNNEIPPELRNRLTQVLILSRKLNHWVKEATGVDVVSAAAGKLASLQRAPSGDHADGPATDGVIKTFIKTTSQTIARIRPHVHPGTDVEPDDGTSQSETELTLEDSPRKGQNNEQLPTHLWHAKRAKMSTPSNPFYDKPTPLSRNSKSARSMHRAYNTSAFVCDTSHRGFLEVSGPEDAVVATLEPIGIRYRPKTDAWIRGCRVWVGMIHSAVRGDDDPHTVPQDIVPARAVWDPLGPLDGSSGARRPPERKVLIEVEPQFADKVRAMLVALNENVKVRDRSSVFGCIDLLGPGSTEKLHGILQPFHFPSASEYERRHWALLYALKHVQPSMVSGNIFLAFSIRFPEDTKPRRDGVSQENEGETHEDDAIDGLLNTQEAWASESHPRQIALLDDRVHRQALHVIRERQPVSGRQDDESAEADGGHKGPIPIMLVCSGSTVRGLEGKWTIICPRDMVRPLWHRLARHHQRDNLEVACVDEMHQIYTEQGVPFFPKDYPTTPAGFTWELKERQLLHQEFLAQPKGKRADYGKLNLSLGAREGAPMGEHGNPWACDWELVLLGKSEPLDKSEPTSVATQPFVVRAPPKIGSLHLRNIFLNPSMDAHDRRESIPEHGLLTVRITMLSGGVPLPRARIYVLPSRIKCKSQRERVIGLLFPTKGGGQGHKKNSGTRNGNGVSKRCSNRRFPASATPEERMRLLATSLTQGTDAIPATGGGHNSAKKGAGTAALDAQKIPVFPEDLVGFVTSGGFNLASGKGQAIAHLGARKICAMVEEAVGSSSPQSIPFDAEENFWCLVRNVGETVARPAVWKVLEEVKPLL